MEKIDVYNEFSDNYLLMEMRNHELRGKLAQNLSAIKDPREKIIALRNHFAKDFDYDYQFIFSGNDYEWRNFKINGKEYESQSVQYEHILPSSVYLTKLGRCAIYSEEVDYLINKNGIACNPVIAKKSPCLNIYKGQFENMKHQYNQAKIEVGKKKKLINIDICALIFERDAKARDLDIDYSKLHELNTPL